MRGVIPFGAVEAVKDRLARGEDVRTTRARREPCSALVGLGITIECYLPILERVEPSLLWSNCGQEMS